MFLVYTVQKQFLEQLCAFSDELPHKKLLLKDNAFDVWY